MGMFISGSSFAQNFHFVYLRLDNSMNIDLVKEQITKLKSEFQDGNFVLFYSNEKTAMDAKNWNEKKLFGLIGEQMASNAITIPNEIDTISDYLENYLQLGFKESENGEKRLYSKKYSSMSFDFLVGNDFVKKYKYQDEILAQTIIINSLSDFNFRINFYPCGADYSDIKFDSQYSINKKVTIKNL